ncbi:YeiH family protein [Alkalihalobacterium sp. APHAB7]|uniref:YeiH family protein n=1 Tax=Alkalihalobacterium sp. APHAB7 TaxID=3402081 RepID=UPI003AAFF9D0
MKKTLSILPGVILCLIIMLCGELLSKWLGIGINYLQNLPKESTSPISGIFLSIILGLIIRNVIGLHKVFKDGVAFSVKYLLKLGIILLGIRLSFFDVITLGAWGLPIILVCVICGLIITLWFTNKMNQSHRLGTLTAIGTGICGVTAIVGTAPAIKANDEETAYAIANITVFGIIAMFFYPYLAYYLFENDPIKAGLFLGASIHETAQVAGAALIYSQAFNMPQIIDVATITKLTRNALLIIVVPIMSYYYINRVTKENQENFTSPKWYSLIPLFVVGFIVMAIIRTIGDSTSVNQGLAFGLLDPNKWETLWQTLNLLGSKYIMVIAMAGVGLTTNIKVFKGLGIKPFYIGIAASFSITVIALLMVYLLGGFITLR